MEKCSNIIKDRSWHLEISPESILFFDLDGTLIQTNFLNNYAYFQAYHAIMKHYMPKTYAIRITRQIIKNISDVTTHEYDAIIAEKERLYSINIDLAKPITNTVKLLKYYSVHNKIYIITRCLKKRAVETVRHFNLLNHVNDLISSKSLNKYEEAINILDLNPKDIIVFEDDDKEIDDCIKVGILEKNIIKISCNE